MMKIDDPRAPFQSIDEALAVGKEHMARLGWFPVGMVVEYQPSGRFVRIAGTTCIDRGGRAGRKRIQHHVAEIGRISDLESRTGISEGQRRS